MLYDGARVYARGLSPSLAIQSRLKNCQENSWHRLTDPVSAEMLGLKSYGMESEVDTSHQGSRVRGELTCVWILKKVWLRWWRSIRRGQVFSLWFKLLLFELISLGRSDQSRPL